MIYLRKLNKIEINQFKYFKEIQSEVPTEGLFFSTLLKKRLFEEDYAHSFTFQSM